MPLFNPGGGGVLVWQALTLGTNVTSFGTPYGSPAAALGADGIVHLRGLFAIGGSISGGAVVATLPDAAMFPPAQRACKALDANAGNLVLGFTVRTDGTIRNVSAWATTHIPGFDDVSFAVA